MSKVTRKQKKEEEQRILNEMREALREAEEAREASIKTSLPHFVRNDNVGKRGNLFLFVSGRSMIAPTMGLRKNKTVGASIARPIISPLVVRPPFPSYRAEAIAVVERISL